MRLQRRRRAVGLLFLAALPLAQRAAAHPGLADSVPSGRRVPCPPGWASCVDGVCPGVGHASCAGATLPLNAFGTALKAARYEWTRELCEADSDGDGWTNGEELGDPCCAWRRPPEGAPPQPASAVASHPGSAASTPPPGAARAAACAPPQPLAAVAAGPTLAPSPPPSRSRFLQPGEAGGWVELRAPRVAVPRVSTSYFAVPFTVVGLNASHAVGFEPLVDSAAMHHMNLFGCRPGAALPAASGVAVGPAAFKELPGCHTHLWGWLPGVGDVATPPDAGFELFDTIVLQLHYNNPEKVGGTVDASGARLHFSAAPRAQPLTVVWTGGVVALFEPDRFMPPGQPAYFDTHFCVLSLGGGGAEGPAAAGAAAVQPPQPQPPPPPRTARVVAAMPHAHRTARRVWTDVYRLSADGSGVDAVALLARDDAFRFEAHAPAAPDPPVALRDGDVIATSCVYNSTGRRRPVRGGVESDNEMCLAYLTVAGVASCTNHSALRMDVGRAGSQSLVAGASGPLPPGVAGDGGGGGGPVDARLLFASAPATHRYGVLGRPGGLLALLRRAAGGPGGGRGAREEYERGRED